MLTRRSWLLAVPAAATVLVSRRAFAAEAIPVKVPNHAIGAVVVAVGGTQVAVERAPLEPTMIAIAGADPVGIAQKVRLKGGAEDHGRFLDDPRNAARVGAHIRDALTAARPELAATFKANHKRWSRSLTLKVLRWTKALEACPVKGKRVKDSHGRIYFLEWVGAKIDSNGEDLSSLASLPSQPSDSTPAAYETYIAALVASVA
jgi:ABC-type Zn uptake system ZnuABC Zn-binding protein ZnuA